MKQKQIIVGVLVVIALVVVTLFLRGSFSLPGLGDVMSSQEVSTEEPIDVVFNFYEPWLAAVQSTSTDPYQSGLADNPILSKALRAQLAESKDNQEVDPVLCQNPLPTQLAGRPLYVHDDKAEILIYSREDDRAGNAIVTLLPLKGGWYIDNILCSRGEFDVPREFTFEREGRLLKSVPPPLNPDYWHLVYEQDGVAGYAAQLFFDAESMCTDTDGKEAVCSPNEFTQTKKVMIQGGMTEYGVEVKKVKFLE